MQFLELVLAFSIFGSLAHCETEPSLKFVQVLYRHGQRTPAAFYPKDIHQKEWAEGLGQLTNIGKQGEYEIGQFLKKTYIESGFMSSKYSGKDIYVRSTDVDRTLESAELALAGLYPPNATTNWNKKLLWQPIPVHTIPVIQDNLLSFGGPYCPRYWLEYKKAHGVGPLKKFIAKYQPLFDFLTNKTGMKITFDNAWIVADDTFNEKLHDLSVPDWLQNVWDELKEEWNENFGMFVPNNKLKRLKGGPLVKFMLEQCDRHISKKHSLKMYQYSAHDTTLAIFFSALDIFNEMQPPYSAVVMVELYQINNTSKNVNEAHALKISYRNDTEEEPYTLTIPGCSELCRLDTFKELTQDIIPNNITEECMIKSSKHGHVSHDGGMASKMSISSFLGLMYVFLFILANY